MVKLLCNACGNRSPSTRRAWIEISSPGQFALIVQPSPSTRRAWIEIATYGASVFSTVVALHPEGVDRNTPKTSRTSRNFVALHPEGVDRNQQQ